MAYVDGEIPPDDNAQIARHLEHCAACGDVIDGCRQTSRDLSSWAVEPPPPMAVPRLPEDMTEPPRRRFGWPRKRVWGALGACAALIAIVFLPVMPIVSRDSLIWTAVSGPSGGGGGGGPAAQAAVTLGVTAASESPATPLRVGGGGYAGQPAGAPTPRFGGQTERTAGPLVARTAQLRVICTDVDAAHAAIAALPAQFGGFAASLQVSLEETRARTIDGYLHVPSARLNDALAAVRALGRVTADAQSAQDVTEQTIDVEARLANGRTTEQRLTEILRTRTGNLEEVLSVERELARVRGEIEGLERQRRSLETRVSYAVIAVSITEEQTASLDTSGRAIGRSLWHAAIEGVRIVRDAALATLIGLLRFGPVLLVGALVLWWPVRKVWRLTSQRSIPHMR